MVGLCRRQIALSEQNRQHTPATTGAKAKSSQGRAGLGGAERGTGPCETGIELFANTDRKSLVEVRPCGAVSSIEWGGLCFVRRGFSRHSVHSNFQLELGLVVVDVLALQCTNRTASYHVPA
jgi:hypothetical protein